MDTTMPDFEGMLTSTAPAHGFPAHHEPAATGSAGNPFYESIDYSLHHSSPSRSSPGPVTCWEILTVQLGQFARDQMALGIIPTDEQLQVQARTLIYGDEDAWNQTAADNTEWLELFKKAHGMPSTATDLRVDFDEDLGATLRFDNLIFDDQENLQNDLGMDGRWNDVAGAHLGLAPLPGQTMTMGMDLPATTANMGEGFPVTSW
jgi:hypothetical protein